MRKNSTRGKRQLENQLWEDLLWDWVDEDADYWDRQMYEDWLSEQTLAEGETVCEVVDCGEFMVLLHHGAEHIEAANFRERQELSNDERRTRRPSAPAGAGPVKARS